MRLVSVVCLLILASCTGTPSAVPVDTVDGCLPDDCGSNADLKGDSSAEVDSALLDSRARDTVSDDSDSGDGLGDGLADVVDTGDLGPDSNHDNGSIDQLADLGETDGDGLDSIEDSSMDLSVDLDGDTGDWNDLSGSEAGDDNIETDSVEDSDTSVEEPPCPPYPEVGHRFCGKPLHKKLHGIRLMFSYVGNSSDASVCGDVSWKLGNRILMHGSTPDGMERGKFTGPGQYYDYDEQLEDDLYTSSDGSEKSYPFIIELLDSDKEVVWRGRRREPLQVREYILKALESNTGMAPAAWMITLVQSIISADFEAYTTVVPDLPGAKYVRFAREWSSAEKAVVTCDTSKPMVLPVVLAEGSVTVPDAELSDIEEIPLEVFTDKTSELEVKRVAGTADPSNAVNLVILGDGYTIADKSQFDADAASVAAYAAALPPYSDYAGFVNIWSVWTPSSEQGASFDCTCSSFDSQDNNCTEPHDGCVDGLRDNMYGSLFAVRAIYKANPFSSGTPSSSADRNLFPLYLFRAGMAMGLTDSNGLSVSGAAAFVITNDQKKGAFGLFNAAVTTAYGAGDQGPDYLAVVATHEMGHAFGLLGDEYSTSTDVCQVFELTPLFPNFSPIVDSMDDLPWALWATLPPPYPYLDSDVSPQEVGCIVPPPGGGKCEAEGSPLVCRPTKTCKMKSNGGEFCSVCQDHLIHRIFNNIDIILSERFLVQDNGDGTWTLDLELAMADVSAEWYLNGQLVQSGPYAPFVLEEAQLASGPNDVRCLVTHNSQKSRVWSQALTEEMSVTVEGIY